MTKYNASSTGILNSDSNKTVLIQRLRTVIIESFLSRQIYYLASVSSHKQQSTANMINGNSVQCRLKQAWTHIERSEDCNAI